MKTCKICGSYAINPHMHGRVGDNLGLCDVCYWRERHNALVEAVAWERETYEFWEFGRTYTLVANDEALESMFAARAEVDRLIANEGSADCEGKG